MVNEGFDAEEWDADFLDQLVQAEELALSTQLPQHNHHPPPPPPRPPPPPCEVSYSPPRELSQRTHETYHTGGIPDSFAPRGTFFAKEQEIDRLEVKIILKCADFNQDEDNALWRLCEVLIFYIFFGFFVCGL